jgi:UDP-N-acetylmuramoyl-tripeptide--D-alanyl-D-alanine ligase
LISLRFEQLAAMTDGKLLGDAHASRTFSGVSIDTRTIEESQLFIAIRGNRHDGHDHIGQAIERNAAGLIVERTYRSIDELVERIPVVAVDDSHQAMIRLAGEYRRTLDTKFIGITGSNGKTTTKEFAYHILRALTTDIHRSPGNLNNLFGVPLALFGMPKDVSLSIFELGISTPDEMPILAAIIRPAVIVITNVGPSHLEFLDSVESVARAKLHLVREADPTVPVIINADDPVLVRETKRVRDNAVTFGIDNEATFMPEDVTVGDEGTTRVRIDGSTFHVSLPGRHQVYNFLAAYAVARVLGFSFENVATERIALDTAPMRGQLTHYRGITIMADCYNANPESVKAGLQSFFSMSIGTRRLLILGDMLELGRDAEKYHRDVGGLLTEYKFDLAAFVGPLSRHTQEVVVRTGCSKDRCRHFDTAEDCAAELGKLVHDGDFVYIKGSRGIGLEAVLEALGSEGETD